MWNIGDRVRQDRAPISWPDGEVVRIVKYDVYVLFDGDKAACGPYSPDDLVSAKG